MSRIHFQSDVEGDQRICDRKVAAELVYLKPRVEIVMCCRFSRKEMHIWKDPNY